MDWSEIFSHRYQLHRRWPTVWHLPTARKRGSLVLSQLDKCQRVMDVGADDREWQERLCAGRPERVYRSMDINRSRTHDWYDLDDVDETFDGILLLEVIEHLPLEDGVTMLKRLHELLEPGGRLVMSTPNIWHPPQYLRDATHVQPWAYDELGGVLTAVGFDVDGIWRLWNGSGLQRLVMTCGLGFLHRQLGLDHARTILVSAIRR